MIYNKDTNTKERVMIMYLTIEILGAEISEIMEKKYGEKDLYKLDDVLNAVVNKIDDLKYEIEELKEKTNNSSDDADVLYEMEAGK
jgi:FtsZ-binding cell division protein ZapB